jgi:hypothetical protein
LTTLLSSRQDEVVAILGVPPTEPWRLFGCVPLGYPTGRWGVAPRRPVHEVTFRNRWGTSPGVEVPEPLWHAPEEDGVKRDGRRSEHPPVW